MVNPSLRSVRDIRNNSLGNSNNIGHNHLKLNSLSHNSNDNICKTNFSGHNSLTIFHQNIRGLQSKTNELISSLHPELPHVLCLTELHLNYDNLHCTYIEHYNYGAAYCRKNFKLGGSCVFVHENQTFLEVNLSAFCKEKE
jgi:hypothetical protein